MEVLSPQYLAGVFDSDGSFSIARRHPDRKTPNYTAVVQLTWRKSENSRMFMELLCSQYGGIFCDCKSTNRMKSLNTKNGWKNV